jgi:hypothetical protein
VTGSRWGRSSRSPWPDKCSGIISGDLKLQMTEIRASEALSHSKLFSSGNRCAGQPIPFVETNRVDDKNIPLPFADRMSLPTRFQFRRVRPSVQKCLNRTAAGPSCIATRTAAVWINFVRIGPNKETP